jgi:hypothetical protein
VLTAFSELSELFTLVPGVDVCPGNPVRVFSGSRPPAPFAVGIWEPGPCDDEISRDAGGSAPPCCCLLFLPNRNDIAAAGWPTAASEMGTSAAQGHIGRREY